MIADLVKLERAAGRVMSRDVGKKSALLDAVFLFLRARHSRPTIFNDAIRLTVYDFTRKAHDVRDANANRRHSHVRDNCRQLLRVVF